MILSDDNIILSLDINNNIFSYFSNVFTAYKINANNIIRFGICLFYTPWFYVRNWVSKCLLKQPLVRIGNAIPSFMISIHSRVVHLSHLKEMSAIFSITTDINDISAQVLDRDFLLVLNVNQFLSRDQSREESGFNF